MVFVRRGRDKRAVRMGKNQDRALFNQKIKYNQ